MCRLSKKYTTYTATGSRQGSTMKYVSGWSVIYYTNYYWISGGETIKDLSVKSVIYYTNYYWISGGETMKYVSGWSVV